MVGRLVVVSGTGTGIGKTHVAEALLLALGHRGIRAAGIKPVETGFDGSPTSDEARLARASPFHVKHSGVRFSDPVSPHLAAREAGRVIALADLVAEIEALRCHAEVVLAELAGGLFSPLSDTETNADLANALRPDVLLLVAPDRLGVLHDVIAATRAAEAGALPVDGIVLVAPDHPDTSTGRNAPEIARMRAIPVFGPVPRGSPEDLSRDPDLLAIASRVAP
ncbi:MAG: dethiobiotin synthase [Polyangiaceae bacterium]